MSEETNKNIQIKWYLRPVMVFLEILLLGPLAIPLVWMSPALKKWHKIIITAILLILTIWFVKLTADIYRIFLNELKKMDEILGH